ncbi:MAG: hypothetical protein M3217_06455 [Actinomycetota bacterium]|nr:hypothetical protein [Actinomycetota bacterium]
MPDGGPRLVTFSGAHGLTALDAFGTALLLVGWLLPVASVLHRPELRTAVLALASHSRYAFAGGVGTGLIVASVFADFGGWWAAGAALLAGLQVYALVRISRRVETGS